MNKILIICLFFFSFLLFFIPHSSVLSQGAVADRYIIKFNDSVTAVDRLKFHRQIGAEFKGQIDKLNADIISTISANSQEFLRYVRRDPRIIYAEPDYKAYTSILTSDPGITNGWQWGMFKIKAADKNDSAWNITTGISKVKIAVLDTGIDQNNEDLTGKIIANNNCTDGNSYDDYFGHGTHVAGIIAANANNGLGIAGVSFQTSLMNAKALGDDGSGYYSWIANCIVWATDHGANVINMSLGGASASNIMEEAIKYAYQKGVVIVAAAGNSGSSTPSYPAYYPQVIAVSAIDKDDKKPSWSNYGSWVDVAAPGVDIYSTLPNHANYMKNKYYGYLSGTSMATPFVSGLAGLILSLGNMNSVSVKNIIEQNAEKIAGTGIYWVSGRINAYKSLLSVVPAGRNADQITPTPTFTPTTTPTPTVIIITPTPTLMPLKPTIAPNTPWRRLCNRYPQMCQ